MNHLLPRHHPIGAEQLLTEGQGGAWTWGCRTLRQLSAFTLGFRRLNPPASHPPIMCHILSLQQSQVLK